MTTIKENTIVQITLTKLMGILGTLLTIIFGFYMLAIKPDIDEIKENQKNFNEKFMELNNGIGTINGSIQGLNDRFTDLRELTLENEKRENTGGGF